LVVILGSTSKNIGAGMTGGRLFTYQDQDDNINKNYIDQAPLSDEDESELKDLLSEYLKNTDSSRAKSILDNWDKLKSEFRKYIPVKQIQATIEENNPEKAA
ncbi:MAG: hypothetical protein LAT57_09160, partial [Balneolales bacterium]|nr:hypothetical protein [Balneolales bacterium]